MPTLFYAQGFRQKGRAVEPDAPQQYKSAEKAIAAAERSDVCAIFALEIIAEAVVAEVLASAVAKRLGGDSMQEVVDRYNKLP